MARLNPVLEGNLAAVASHVLWATSFPATQILLSGWDPVLLTAGRLVTALVAILLLFPLLGRRPRFAGMPWPAALRIGGLFMAPSVLLAVWGQALSDPLTAAIIITSMPLVSALIGWAAGTERLHPALLGGLALAIAGGIVASSGNADRLGFRGGELLVLGSVTLWTLYSRAVVRDLAALDDLSRSLVTMLCGAGTLVLVSLVLVTAGLVPPRLDLSPGMLGVLLWMGTVGVGLTLPLWLVAARHLGVTIAAMHQNLLPFYVMVFSLLLGGTFGARALLGALLVSLGALVAQLPWRRLLAGRLKPS